MTLLYTLLAGLFGASIGALAHSAWMEARHDCLPHDAGIGCADTSDKKRATS